MNRRREGSQLCQGLLSPERGGWNEFEDLLKLPPVPICAREGKAKVGRDYAFGSSPAGVSYANATCAVKIS